MFDGLFSKSINKKFDLTDRKERFFSEKNLEKFRPRKEKEVLFYNEKVIRSINDNSLKFTNHYSDKTPFETLKRIEDLNSDLSIIRKSPMTTVNFNVSNSRRVLNIINKYLDDFKPDDLNEDRISKVTLLDPMGQQDGVRVYFLINENFDAYEIIIIDLFHLVIPADYKQRNGKIIKKDKMLNITYDKNMNNKECISAYFGY